MTKKDFVAIAASIKAIDSPTQRKLVAASMVNTCTRSNPRFDRDRFLTACGVKA